MFLKNMNHYQIDTNELMIPPILTTFHGVIKQYKVGR
jgi:hypothetical protein